MIGRIARRLQSRDLLKAGVEKGVQDPGRGRHLDDGLQGLAAFLLHEAILLAVFKQERAYRRLETKTNERFDVVPGRDVIRKNSRPSSCRQPVSRGGCTGR